MRLTSDTTAHDADGRESVRHAMTRMLERTHDGHRLMALVYGDAGHGKSTMLDKLVADAKAMGSVVVPLVGDALNREIPYAGVHSLLTRNFDLLGSPQTPAERLLRRMVTDFSPPSSALTMCSAVSDWIDCLSSAPIVICVDDADHMDEDSLRVLAYAASRHQGGYVTVVCTATNRVPLLERVGAAQFTLDDLNAQAANALLAKSGLPTHLAPILLDRLGGNPLALEHASSVLVDQVPSSSPHTLDVVPVAIRLCSYIDERLQALPPSSGHFLEAIAVSKQRNLEMLDAWAATAALGSLDALVRDAESSGLVEADNECVRWRRPWMAESLNARCSVARRRRLQAQLTSPEPSRPRSTSGLGRPGATSLTDAELRVASIVTYGGTNREAAERLHVSEKTIETHLQHIYRKLEVRSRTQLAARLFPLLDEASDTP
jgi:DNA-binding CsgD family transcriptional regulator